MENTFQTQPQRIAAFKRCQAHCLQFEDLHIEHDEDRICSDVISSSYPLIIVADGVSTEVDPSTGKVVTGKGGPAAQEAVEAARRYLGSKLHDLASVEEVLRCLHGMYDCVIQDLKDNNLEGSATLLVVLLTTVHFLSPPIPNTVQLRITIASGSDLDGCGQ